MPQRLLLAVFLAVFLIVLAGGCAPSLSPLYRDYEVSTAEVVPADSVLQERIRTALREAGWEPEPSAAPNVVATAPRTVRNWGLYRVAASLEVAPLGPDHVRVYIHPYRRYVTGSRSKVPYLSRGLRHALLPPLTEAFEKEGLILLRTPIKRDEAQVADGR